MKYKKKSNTMREIGVLLPILIALCLTPFIVLTKDYQTEFTAFDWFSGTELDQIDSFEQAKSVCVMMMGAIAAIVIAVSQYGRYKKEKLLFGNCDRKVLVLCAVYFVMVILSSVFSKYPNLVFVGGGYSQWQTMWVLLAYVMLFLYAYVFLDSETRVSVLIKCLIVSTGLLALIGVMQTAGHNPLSWDWAQKIITSQSRVPGIKFKDGISNVIITFLNPNYVGPYVALMLPIAVSFATLRVSKDAGKTVLCRIAGVLIAIGLIVSLFGSSSSAGAIAVAAGVVAAAVMILSGILTKESAGSEGERDVPDADAGGKSRRNYVIGAIAVIVIVIAGVGITRTAFFENTMNKLLQGGVDTRNIASIVNSENTLEVTLRNGEEFVLTMLYEEGSGVSFQAHDAGGQEIPVQWSADQNGYVLDDDRFRMITLETVNFSVEENVYPGFRFKDVPNDITWTFMCVDGDWNYYTPFGKFMKLHEVESFGFENYQNIANRRGYIWSRTIPLMKTYWFKGIGPNAFIIAFPNDDFVGSKRVGGDSSLVDKPHNAFLQIWVQTGGISALAYVGLWILYVLQSVLLLWRRKHYTEMEKISLGLLVGIFSFAVAGLTNDTIVGTQYLYWILLGAGYAVNRVIRTGREAVRIQAEEEAAKREMGKSARSKRKKR